MRACPDCQFENAPNATFCVNCGRPLSLAPASSPLLALEGERRFVTVLFADLSGFTSLSEQRDPEAVREVVNACFDQLVPIIENHQGVVDQFVGDALLALYGAPYAHEDDPAQACRAALEMMDALAQVNAAHRVALGLHIGINSGMVLAGGIGSRGRQQYSVLGDPVNVASRLQDAAESGEIFVGEETYRLTREQFEFQARGTMIFKGKAEPQPVWQLLRPKETSRQHRRVHMGTPLLGRERELALLQRVTREFATQRDAGLRLVSILGDAGLGKSRLVQEWSEWARDLSAFVPRIASCAPDSSTRAYALLAELGRVLNEARSAFEPSTALNLLLGAHPSVQPSEMPRLDAQALQMQYVNALGELLMRHSTDTGLVLVCEDVHWADAPSVEVLQRVLQGNPTRLLLCLTARIDPETPGWKLIESTEELPGAAAVRLHLTPLSDDDAQSLLNDLVAGALPDEARRLILAQAEGNPLFVEELVRMLVDRGDLRRKDDEWILARELVTLDVPNTLQGVLMTRVDQLPSDARRILQIASVLGREFPLEVLERVLAQMNDEK